MEQQETPTGQPTGAPDRTAAPEAAMSAAELGRLVDLARYPLDRPGSPGWREAVALARAGLAESGCARLPGFVRPQAVKAMAAEVDRVAGLAHHSVTRHNPYFSADDPSLPADDPRHVFMTRSNAMLCYDQLDAGTAGRRLYADDTLMAFLTDCLSLDAMYRYADPISALAVNIMEPGKEFPWHFDTNEFTTSILLRQPEAGGRFEYVPDLRTADSENYGEVAKVLAGERGRVRDLALQPGDLQIFKGRYSMHRVTRAEGRQRRTVLLFSYARIPNVIARAGRSLSVYGRVTQAHLDAEQRRARADGLIDG